MNKIYTFPLSNIDDVARQFVADMGTSKIFAFYGAMGAGKTTFIAALCKALSISTILPTAILYIISIVTASIPYKMPSISA